MLITALGIAIVALVGCWIVGGVLLRLGGLIVMALGVAALLTANNLLGGIIALAAGFLLWLGGHWHYALRHHAYRSPLARRIFLQLLPRWLDPTRDWATPVIGPHRRPQ